MRENDFLTKEIDPQINLNFEKKKHNTNILAFFSGI